MLQEKTNCKYTIDVVIPLLQIAFELQTAKISVKQNFILISFPYSQIMKKYDLTFILCKDLTTFWIFIIDPMKYSSFSYDFFNPFQF